MDTGEKIKALIGDRPNSLSISFNTCWGYYQTVKSAIEEGRANGQEFDFVSEEDKQRCIETESLWHVQYYPRTPVGFNDVYASSLDIALDYLLTDEET